MALAMAGGERRQDRRAVRTRTALTQALIELLLQRGWEAIGVGELCARADVSRSTFYLHFSNKEELLESGFAALRAAIQPAGGRRKPGGPLAFIDALAAHLYENRRAALAIIGAKGSGIVRERFRLLLLNMIRDDLGRGRAADHTLAHFLSGGFVALAGHLLAVKASRAGDLAEAFHSMALPLL